MLHKMPIILIILIISILIFNPLLPVSAKQIMYALSLTIKSGIIFILPFIIFSLLFKAAVGLAHRASLVIAYLLILICCSNFCSTFLSHYVGSWIYHFDLSLILPKEAQGLMPAWSCSFPKWIPNNVAMFLGLSTGIILGAFKANFAQKLAGYLEWLVSKLLKSFTFFIPLFVTGFVMKLQYDGVIQTIIKDYASIFFMIAAAQFTYIFLAYFIINHFTLHRAWSSIKNMLPAAIAGFSTMSSAAVMPLTILGAESNAKNKDVARSVIPASVNVHLVGDCFAIPIFAFAVMKSFGLAEPTFLSYLIFVCYFVLAKFSVAAIPGGGIIVMLPILETYLGFNAEMLSLITALYILFDPVITCTNVLGNGAFAQLVDRLQFANKRSTYQRPDLEVA